MSTSDANACIFYNKTLAKQIPCFLVPGTIYNLNNNEKYAKILFDYDKFTTGSFNVSRNEVIRYVSDTIRINDIYPYVTQEQKDYAIACIPNHVANDSTFNNDEMLRMRQLVEMFVNTPTIKANFFYTICDFISYDLLFTYLTKAEREYMAYIANYLVIGAPRPEPIPIIHMLYTCRIVFEAFPEDNTQVYFIQNARNLVAYSETINFPIPIIIPILKANIFYLTDEE